MSPSGWTSKTSNARSAIVSSHRSRASCRALHVLMLPDHERARRIGEFYGDPRTQTFAQLLIDLEESPHARAVVLGELREEEMRGES